MSRFFYSVFFYLAVPFVLLRLVWRSRKEPEYRAAVWQRFGFYRVARPGDVIWVHAVSAGETIAAVPLVKRLIDRGCSCVVTSMTPTGRERVRTLLGDSVDSCYAAYDLPGSVARFLTTNKPRMLITIDTELWPNTMAACGQRNIPVLLVNGRMSGKSARGYAGIRRLSQPMFSGITRLAVQSEAHRHRFVRLGADPERVHVTGSIKFDGERGDDLSDSIVKAQNLVGARPVLLGASTHEGEESALVEAFNVARKKVPDLLLVLAPRHTHRVRRVADLCQSNDLSLTRFSDTGHQGIETEVLLVDVMGELAALYHVARVALVGGSLVPVGGHNLLEGVRAGCVVMMGPHLDNIEDITAGFEDAGGMIMVRDTAELCDQVVDLLCHEARRRDIIRAANRVLESNRGSLDRIEQLIVEVLGAEG